MDRRKASMKRPGLLQGIIVAVLLSLAAPAVHYLVDLLVPRMLALKLVMAVLTTAYVFYLLRLHHARIGNIVLGTGTALILIAALLWGMATSTLVSSASPSSGSCARSSPIPVCS